MKFSKTQLSKMIQSGEFLTDISANTSGSDNIVNFPFKVLELCSKELNSSIDTKNIRIIRIKIVFTYVQDLI